MRNFFAGFCLTSDEMTADISRGLIINSAPPGPIHLLFEGAVLCGKWVANIVSLFTVVIFLLEMAQYYKTGNHL